jgi:hypothetical protein
MIKELREAKQERDRLVSIMTQYERRTVSEYIGETAERYRPTIEGGALAIVNAAKANLKAALKNVEAQKRKITNSFDSAKLESEMSLVQRRMEIAAKGDNAVAALQDLYAEYQQSGDRTKAKAAGEVFKGVVNFIPRDAQDKHGTDARQVANRIANQAAADLQSLAITPELTAAHELAAAKVAEFNAAQAQAEDAAEVMGTPVNLIMPLSAIEKALSTVQQDRDGNFIFTDKE